MVRRSGICLDSVVGYGVDPGGVRTSEVAARANVNVETLRYYQRRGLLAEPARSASGYRSMHDALARLIESCDLPRARGHCPLLTPEAITGMVIGHDG